MSFIHFMSLKLIKTTQKCLIFWNLLGVLINKVLIKKSKFILHSFYFLQMFRNHPKMFAIFKLIRQFLLIKVPRKIEIIGVKCQQIFFGITIGAIRGLQIGAGFSDCKSGQEGIQNVAALGISNRGKKKLKRGRDYKPGQGFQIGAGITSQGRTTRDITYLNFRDTEKIR